MKTKKQLNIIKMVELAMLTAIVLILQLAGLAVKLPFLGTPVSLVLIPITLGAILLGPLAGAFLGFVFGVEVFVICGVMGGDPLFTAVLFANHPLLTGAVCIVKSTAAGFLSGLVYCSLKNRHGMLATFLAAGITPVVNTGLFLLGCFTMMDTVSAIAAGAGQKFLYFVVIGCAGINFLFEFAINMIFAPAIGRIALAVRQVEHDNV